MHLLYNRVPTDMHRVIHAVAYTKLRECFTCSPWYWISKIIVVVHVWVLQNCVAMHTHGGTLYLMVLTHSMFKTTTDIMYISTFVLMEYRQPLTSLVTQGCTFSKYIVSWGMQTTLVVCILSLLPGFKHESLMYKLDSNCILGPWLCFLYLKIYVFKTYLFQKQTFLILKMYPKNIVFGNFWSGREVVLEIYFKEYSGALGPSMIRKTYNFKFMVSKNHGTHVRPMTGKGIFSHEFMFFSSYDIKNPWFFPNHCCSIQQWLW